MIPANDNGQGVTRKDRPIGDSFATDIFVHSDFSRLNRGFLHPGYVYVVGFDRFVKIGFTRNFEQRKIKLQAGVPIHLDALNVFVGDKTDERALMDYFCEYSTGYGEWFHWAGALSRWIDAGLPYDIFEAATGRMAA